jgi:hypothetical protein
MALSAAATRSVVVEKSLDVEYRVMMHAPSDGSDFSNKSRTPFRRQYHASVRRRAFRRDLVVSRIFRDFPRPASRLCCGLSLEPVSRNKVMGMIRMNHVMKIFAGAALLVTLVSVARADDFELSHHQRISCSRGLSAGKLNTATCRSYAYIFNVKTSEYFRCSVSLALTRDNKEVINVQTDGNCTKRPRIFETDSHYSFDATETEAVNTNSFFGPGGYAVWAADTTAQKVRGCITISSGLGSDISKCLDMTFQ